MLHRSCLPSLAFLSIIASSAVAGTPDASATLSRSLPLALESEPAPGEFIAHSQSGECLVSATSIRILSPDGTTVTISFPEGAATASLEMLDPLPGIVNYLGGGAIGSRTNIPTFQRARYRNVFPGIDIEYHGDHRQLEFDLVVQPGADPANVQFRIPAAKVAPAGDLTISTGRGEITKHAPLVYEEGRGERRNVQASYRAAGKDLFALRLGNFDRTRRLVIDPVITYSGSFGGNGSSGAGGETLTGVAGDASGNIYVVGHTSPTAAFPLSPGAFSTATMYPYSGLITKMNSSGDHVLYSTYLTALPAGVAADNAGNAYLTAFAGQNNPGPYGCASTAVALKLNDTGSALVYTKCLNFAGPIAVDSGGSAYLGGPGTCPSVPGGTLSGTGSLCIVKLDPAGTTLVYAARYGGSGTDVINAIAVDAGGNAYVTGTTRGSFDFPLVNALQPHQGGTGILSSTDHGATWIPLAKNLPAENPALAANRQGYPQTLYAGFPSHDTSGSLQLYKTLDAGATWIKLGKIPTNPISCCNPPSLLPDPGIASTLYFYFPNGQLNKSTDDGITWKQLATAGTSVASVQIDPNNSSVIYLLANTRTLMKSTDAGATWQAVSVPPASATGIRAISCA